MILPIRYRDEDDSAPVDYQFVASVAEGTRRRQAEPIHEPAAPAAPVPGGRAPYPRRRDNAFARDPNYTPLSEPLQTFAPAEPVSNSRNHSYQGSPAEPVSNSRNHSYQGSPAAQAQPVQAEPPAAPPLTQTQDGSLYAQPAAPEVPDWLRVARQNNLPLEGRPRAPRVAAAPQANSRSDSGSASAAQDIPRDRLGRPLHNARPSAPPPPATDGTAAAYAAAGYPPELVSQMVEQEARERELALRRRHGAQPAEPASNSRNHSYPGSAPAALEANSRNHSYPGSAPAALEAKARYNSYPGSTSASEVNNRYPPNTFAPQANAQPSGYPADAPSPYAPQANPSSANPSYPPPRPQEPRRRRAAPPMQPPVPPDPYEEDAIPEDDDPRNPYVVRTEKRPGRWNDEETQDAPEEITPKKPWLMIAVFAALALAVACWLLQQGFDRETDKVISARAETEQALAEKHPLRYRELIETQSQVNNLNPAFVAAIVLNESSFNSDAESSVGARGLMQLTETTAGWVAPKLGLTDAYSFDNMYHPEDNVRFGCWYLAFLAGRFRDDPILVAAAFHAGQNEVQNWLNDSHYSADGKSITLENMIDGPTKSYVKRVLNDYAAYKRLYYAQTET